MARRRKVDDAEAVGTETDMSEGNQPIIVGAAVRLKVAHLADKADVIFFTALSFQTDQAGYGTHIMLLGSLSA